MQKYKKHIKFFNLCASDTLQRHLIMFIHINNSRCMLPIRDIPPHSVGCKLDDYYVFCCPANSIKAPKRREKYNWKSTVN